MIYDELLRDSLLQRDPASGLLEKIGIESSSSMKPPEMDYSKQGGLTDQLKRDYQRSD